jgi:hypothetical protein
MNSSSQIRLMDAVGICLRPLARMLLRSGIGYKQFSELAKTAFMQEALGERDSRGRMTNVSRIAVRTGLSRKEVARLRARLATGAASGTGDGDSVHYSNHAARVLQLWHSDSRFLTSSGTPMALPFGGDEPSFSSLVRAAGGDVPPGAVRAELSDASSIVEGEHGLLQPVKRYFVPADVGEELVVGFTHIVAPVLEGLARNTDLECTQPFIQRLAYSDRLMPAAIPHFREVARDRASEFVHIIDDWLSSHETRTDIVVGDNCRVGVGVFYYEGQPPLGHSASGDPSGDLANE